LEGSAAAVFLDDFDHPLFAALEGRVLAAAREAFSLAADGKAPFAAIGFQHAVVVFVAKRTADRLVDPLIGVVAALAGQTFAPPTDGEAVVAGARVDHAIVVDTAGGTLHGKPGVRKQKPVVRATLAAAHLADLIGPHNTTGKCRGQPSKSSPRPSDKRVSQ